MDKRARRNILTRDGTRRRALRIGAVLVRCVMSDNATRTARFATQIERGGVSLCTESWNSPPEAARRHPHTAQPAQTARLHKRARQKPQQRNPQQPHRTPRARQRTPQRPLWTPQQRRQTPQQWQRTPQPRRQTPQQRLRTPQPRRRNPWERPQNPSVEYFLNESPHQRIGNGIPLGPRDPPSDTGRRVVCRTRLGGVLRHYFRAAA